MNVNVKVNLTKKELELIREALRFWFWNAPKKDLKEADRFCNRVNKLRGKLEVAGDVDGRGKD